MKLTKYDEQKHNVEGFIFAGWTPTHVLMKGKTAQAVLVKAPGQYHLLQDKWDKKAGRQKPVELILRVRVKGDRTTVVAYPDTVAEANVKLERYFTSES